MKIALDIAKASSLDGLGTWIRELVWALDRLGTDHEWWLTDLLHEDGEGALEALGTLGENFRAGACSRELPWGEIDAVLAASWTLPGPRRSDRTPGAPSPPVLFVAYDLTVFSHPDCHTLGNRLHVSEGLLRAKHEGSRFLAISRATGRELERWLEVPRSSIDVITPGLGREYARRVPSGTPDRAEETDREELFARLRERHGLPEEARGYVLSVGSLEPRKNLARLLSAHEALGEETRRAFPLVLAGGASWRSEKLERRLADQPEGLVRRLGPVESDELPELYSAATLFAYPSLAEGFGLPPLEAMACGAPVMTSDRSSLPEVVGDAALLVDPTEVEAISGALETLLRDRDERQRRRLLGMRRAAAHSWEKAARLTAQSLERTAQPEHPSPA
ncbi:MAG: glycosyltransferase family 1 protein [Acidobacteriota bacterium]